jgi:choline dehydrogenase
LNTYDFIIVGAGSAGCALAYRLSADAANSVLLIEAGPKDDNFFIHMPLGFKQLYRNPKYDWNFQPEPVSNGVRNVPWIRGKVLGGSSSINGMVYVRGQPEDFDGWEQLGNPGWGWKDVLPIYQQMENHELGADELRGVGGPLDVTCHPRRDAMSDAYIAAGVQAGLPAKEDLNRVDQVGIGYFQRTIVNGRRVSSATAFLSRCKDRKNLTVMTDVHVRKVLLSDRRATGVECVVGGALQVFNCNKEVILSAGAVNSPQLLQLSGIGDAAYLRSVGVEPQQHLPGVGGNLQEHFSAGCVHKAETGGLNHEFRGVRLLGNLLKYAMFKRGVMSMAAAQVGAFAMTRPGLQRANAQWHMAPLRLESSTDEVEDPTKPAKLAVAKIGGITSFGCVMQPTPGGDIMITSPDPMKAPRIRYEHLRSEEDQRTTVEIIRLTRKIAEQPALAKFALTEVYPGPLAQSDDQLLAHALKTGVIGYHPAGTCKMGNDALAVVDHELKVHGIRGLRVADASIMPILTSGNTNAPCMMIGMKAGDLILASYR